MSGLHPVAIEAEKSLLGGMIVYPEGIKLTDELAISAKHFFVKSHQLIFNSMIECYKRNQFLDFVSLEQTLKDNNHFDEIGGTQYLASLAAEATSSSNLEYLGKLILDKFQLRQLIEVTGEIKDLAGTKDPLDEILDKAEQKILDITRDRRTSDFLKAGVVAKEVENEVIQLSKENKKQTGMITGYTLLDYITRGFQPGDLILLAARPSVGKTAFALNLALEGARRNDTGVAIFSLEMPAKQLITRMLASMSLVDSKKLQTGFGITQREFNAINEAVITMNQTQIFIDDSSGTKLSDIFSKCRKLKNDNQLGMIVIDYIQLINSSGQYESRQQEVSLISRQLKQLARELNVPVIALSQLSRGVESRSDKRPMLSDLRESGSLEQDADMVLMLYREEYYSEDRTQRPEEEKIEVIIAKHRNGEIGTVPLQFRGAINKYYNITTSEDASIGKV